MTGDRIRTIVTPPLFSNLFFFLDFSLLQDLMIMAAMPSPECENCGAELPPGRPCIDCITAAAAMTVANLDAVATRRDNQQHPRGCRCLPPDDLAAEGDDEGGEGASGAWRWEASDSRGGEHPRTRVRLLDRAAASEAEREIMVR